MRLTVVAGNHAIKATGIEADTPERMRDYVRMMRQELVELYVETSEEDDQLALPPDPSEA